MVDQKTKRSWWSERLKNDEKKTRRRLISSLLSKKLEQKKSLNEFDLQFLKIKNKSNSRNT